MKVPEGTDHISKYWNAENGQLLASTISLPNHQWAVVSPNGQFDKSPDFNGLHFTQGFNVIGLDQFFDDYFTPGLLAQVYQTGGDSYQLIVRLVDSSFEVVRARDADHISDLGSRTCRAPGLWHGVSSVGCRIDRTEVTPAPQAFACSSATRQ